jgi:demethylmenaquinone methyltransferase/2-methoxy-6-polyprenyl-1,4-benzoquinol methylase
VNGTTKGYFYLPKSIRLFPDQEKFRDILAETGFADVAYYNLSAGIVAVHTGSKPT